MSLFASDHSIDENTNFYQKYQLNKKYFYKQMKYKERKSSRR